MDVPPSVAEKEAKLGSVEEVRQNYVHLPIAAQVCRAVKSANVVKPTLDAALELIQILDEKKAFSVSAATPLNERDAISARGCFLLPPDWIFFLSWDVCLVDGC